MNYYDIIKDDVNNGCGFRTTLVITGCNLNCKGCHAQHLKNPNVGKLFTEEVKQELFKEINKPYCSGLSCFGGEITHPANIKDVTKLFKEIKSEFYNKTIWAWTGQDWENVKNMEFVQYVDVLIDGRFILEQRNLKCKWRGSENQRVIDVKNTLKEGKIVLFCE